MATNIKGVSNQCSATFNTGKYFFRQLSSYVKRSLRVRRGLFVIFFDI